MTKDEMKQYIRYLDTLRDSGATNMWGARPYLQKHFKIKDANLASKILTAWMESFGHSHELDIRADVALESIKGKVA